LRLLAGVPQGVATVAYSEWWHSMSRDPFASAILGTLSNSDNEAVHEQCHHHYPH
jgi:hypothetical protein